MVHRPVIIIIDAIDKGYDADILQIFRDEVSKLPGNFQILIISRAEKAIVLALSDQAHVRLRTMDIHRRANLDDVTVYAQFKLRQVANYGEMKYD